MSTAKIISGNSNMQKFVSKTEHYLKVKKPLLERQRRARINKCLDSIKTLVADIQGDTEILRMDKAVMLEALIDFMRTNQLAEVKTTSKTSAMLANLPPVDGFRNGYMNAVNEVSRIMATMPGMNVEIGKSVMTHLGFEFNRILKRRDSEILGQHKEQKKQQQQQFVLTEDTLTAMEENRSSPASSGYHSDDEFPSNLSTSSRASPIASIKTEIWRPW